MLQHPDGTRVVFGNSDVANADPDWVGYLDPEQGITGLDSPDVRESAGDLIQGDGGIHYDFFHGRRPVGFQAVIWPEGRSMDTIVALEQKVKRVTNSMRAGEDVLLRWTNTGLPARRLALRRQQPPRITGRRPKVVTIAMVCADYRILADTETDNGAVAIGTQKTITNVGDEIATPRIVITAGGGGTLGSAGAPIRIRNLTTGVEIRFKPTFLPAAGSQLIVDTNPPYPLVAYNGLNRYDGIDYLPTAWWGLVPGPQDIRVDAGGSTGGASWQLFHRDAWI